jgi:transcription factor C subunit 3
MVYSALQVITRGRDDGVSVVALGKQTGYDQKTCFYLIKQLQELNLVFVRLCPFSMDQANSHIIHS